MIDTILSYLGVLGAVMCVLAYFLLERGKVSAEGIPYYFMNGFGAFLVLVAVLYSFDGGDMGAIVQELCWVIISLMGMFKVLKMKRVKNDQN
jgi:hypothetical protein